MKQMYQQPQVDCVLLDVADVIRTSDNDIYINAERLFERSTVPTEPNN